MKRKKSECVFGQAGRAPDTFAHVPLTDIQSHCHYDGWEPRKYAQKKKN